MVGLSWTEFRLMAASLDGKLRAEGSSADAEPVTAIDTDSHTAP
jgi:hypothetical protein